jgi:hypothetical protein
MLALTTVAGANLDCTNLHKQSCQQMFTSLLTACVQLCQLFVTAWQQRHLSSSALTAAVDSLLCQLPQEQP